MEENEFAIRIRVGDLTIFNFYKPSTYNWNNDPLPSCQHPEIYIGNFNSHSLDRGYSSKYKNGEMLVSWTLVGRKYLVYNVKQGGTFETGRWDTTTFTDLYFVTKDEHDLLLEVNRIVLSKSPKSQH